MRPFEPAEVVRNYRNKRLNPRHITFGVRYRDDGKVTCPDGKCCALSTFFVGETIDAACGDGDYSIIEAARRRWPGFSPWSFVCGFDGINPGEPGEIMRLLDDEPFNEEAYQLGKEVAALVRKEFGV